MTPHTRPAGRDDHFSVADGANDNLVSSTKACFTHRLNRQGYLVLGRDSRHAFTIGQTKVKGKPGRPVALPQQGRTIEIRSFHLSCREPVDSRFGGKLGNDVGRVTFI
jgi:hypothetical protein